MRKRAERGVNDKNVIKIRNSTREKEVILLNTKFIRKLVELFSWKNVSKYYIMYIENKKDSFGGDMLW